MTAPHGKVSKETTYREAELVRSGAPTTIGENVLIGANCSILPGISIGDNSVIEAGSVVTRDVPAFHHFFGNPARPLKVIK
jgi:maltose O-acetyltransferase